MGTYSLSDNSEANSNTQGSRMKELAMGKRPGLASQPTSSYILTMEDGVLKANVSFYTRQA